MDEHKFRESDRTTHPASLPETVHLYDTHLQGPHTARTYLSPVKCRTVPFSDSVLRLPKTREKLFFFKKSHLYLKKSYIGDPLLTLKLEEVMHFNLNMVTPSLGKTFFIPVFVKLRRL